MQFGIVCCKSLLLIALPDAKAGEHRLHLALLMFFFCTSDFARMARAVFVLFHLPRRWRWKSVATSSGLRTPVRAARVTTSLRTLPFGVFGARGFWL